MISFYLGKTTNKIIKQNQGMLVFTLKFQREVLFFLQQLYMLLSANSCLFQSLEQESGPQTSINNKKIRIKYN